MSPRALLSFCSFTGNSAAIAGGAVHFEATSGSAATLRNATFNGNTAGGCCQLRLLTAAISEALTVDICVAVCSSPPVLGNDHRAWPWRAVCRGGALDFVNVDNITITGGLVTNNSVSEWAGNADLGGVCTNQLQLGYTSGNGMHAETFLTMALVNTA